ncbi:MAG: AAA-like domain-containing protein [Nostoc sp.]
MQLAACIGNQFSLEVLSVINNKSQITTARELQPALEAGLILPLSNDYKIPLLWNQEEISMETSEVSPTFIPKIPNYIPYKFLHDQVQQAAYALIPKAEKKAVHLQVGYLLLKNSQKDELEQNIFDIVNQLNEGYELIFEQSKRDNLAQLNLQAGKKAKASIAYQPALKYLETGLKLLNSKSWNIQYKLTLELYLETLELLYLNTKFNRAQALCAICMKQVKETLDKVKVYQIKILSYFAEIQQQKAIETACEALLELGIDVPQEAEEIEQKTNQEYKCLNLFLEDNKIEDLVNLHLQTDPYKIAAILILKYIVSSLNTTNSPLLTWALLTQLNLCIKYGNFPEAASNYSFYVLIQHNSTRDINLAYKFGKLSLNLVDKFKITKLVSLVSLMYYGFAWHWQEHLRNIEAQEKLVNGFQKGIDTGDNEFACYNTISYCLIKLFGGYHLEEVQNDIAKYIKIIKKLKNQYSNNYIYICYKMTKNLIQANNQDFLLIGNSLEEDNKYLEEWTNNKNEWLLFISYLAKTIYFYFFKNFKKAIYSGINAKKYIKSCTTYLSAPQHNFYSSLSFIAVYHDSSQEQKKQIIENLENNQYEMKMWASYCSANFQNKYDLVEAEKARIFEQSWQAQELYEKAIEGAKKSEFIHEEAIAYERAAEFYISLGREEIGKLYLKNAHHCYSRWGAKAKVQALELEYPQFLMDINDRKENQSINTTESTGGTNPQVLDLMTVTKASQVLASEIKLDQLLAKLMKTVIENGGAQKGFLILEKDRKWAIAAESTVDSDDVTLVRSLPIDSVDGDSVRSAEALLLSADRQTPILPVAIVNYVVRTQENVVLNNATEEEQFIRDPYIVATQPKSILCTPLLNQGKLSGILYLENNLTTDAFTNDRIEVLRILSAQAAISIENARLYGQLEDSNRNLELRVEERTQELSQTLEILKATQAELLFENELLKSAEQPSTFDYQVGGSLPMGCPTYVVRSADRYLYKALKRGEFAYILNPRQMGKSSLMVRMIHHLQHEGFSCGAIDLTRIGSENVTPDQWYKGLTVELWRSFGLLRKVNLKTWWQEQGDISPVQRLSQFIEEVLLVEVAQKDDSSPKNLIIFIDEIDNLLGLNFPVNDFFALIRSCYNQRSINPEYQRLTFALFGVITPGDLITDYQRTPFNIGQTIQLEGFKEHEAQPLLQGLTEKVSNPQTVLKEVLAWTSGQPFLTQKLCKLIRNSSSLIPTNREAEWIENLVRRSVIENWESQDEPEHLRTIRDRLFKSKESVRLLELYRHILHQGEIVGVDSLEERELLLSGLVVKQQGILRVQNRIYELIFV